MKNILQVIDIKKDIQNILEAQALSDDEVIDTFPPFGNPYGNKGLIDLQDKYKDKYQRECNVYTTVFQEANIMVINILLK